VLFVEIAVSKVMALAGGLEGEAEEVVRGVGAAVGRPIEASRGFEFTVVCKVG
jgi:hypothetical protein